MTSRGRVEYAGSSSDDEDSGSSSSSSSSTRSSYSSSSSEESSGMRTVKKQNRRATLRFWNACEWWIWVTAIISILLITIAPIVMASMPSLYIMSASSTTPYETLKKLGHNGQPQQLNTDLVIALLNQNGIDIETLVQNNNKGGALPAYKDRMENVGIIESPDVSVNTAVDVCTLVLPNDCSDKWAFAEAYYDTMPRNVPRSAKFRGRTCQASCMNQQDINNNGLMPIASQSLKLPLRNLNSWQGLCVCTQRPNML